jgi:hypothetical protein
LNRLSISLSSLLSITALLPDQLWSTEYTSSLLCVLPEAHERYGRVFGGAKGESYTGTDEEEKKLYGRAQA